MNYHLAITTGPDCGRQVEVPSSETLLIGRGDTCGLRLEDPSVSRVHCRIAATNGRLYIEDAGSRWGTLVNGDRIATKELQPGDRIGIGDTELRLDVDSPAVLTLPPRWQPPVAETSPEPPSAMLLSASDPPNPPPSNSAGVLDAIRLNNLAGERFLRFRVGSVVARTRSGIVYRAHDPRHNRTVALKIFWPQFFADEPAMKRFLRAVRTMLPLEHENLVKLHTAGRWREYCFSVCEYVDGESVTQLIQRIGIAGMLDWRKAWHVAVGVAQALEFAHERNILHRNLGPSNILIRGFDQAVKLGDLMLAKALDDVGSPQITQAGEVIGNLHYAAPETLTGERHIDPRADLYSLGATLYAILTGRPPFEGAGTADLIHQILTRRPEPPTTYHLSIASAFEGVVLRLLAKHPEDRFATAGDLLRDLRRVATFHGI